MLTSLEIWGRSLWNESKALRALTLQRLKAFEIPRLPIGDSFCDTYAFHLKDGEHGEMLNTGTCDVLELEWNYFVRYEGRAEEVCEKTVMSFLHEKESLKKELIVIIGCDEDNIPDRYAVCVLIMK